MKLLARCIAALAVVLAFLLPAPASARQMPGMGTLSGTVAVAKPVGQLSVYAYNPDLHVGYMVYVVDGKYRATNLFPGRYEVTLRGTVGQRNWDLPRQTVKVRVAKDGAAKADFAVKESVVVPQTYGGGRDYPDATVLAYDEVYPPGEGRELMERTCFGCHLRQFYPYNAVRTYPGGRTPKDREGWAITVDRMMKGVAFGTPGKASYFDPLLLTSREREVLVDYLAKNFGAEAPPRVVRQETDPVLDPAALERAQFVEYRFPNGPEEERYTHTPDFDGQGNVWIMDRGGERLVKVDPRTAKVTEVVGHGSGEFLAVDRDGTIWYGGVNHYDPRTGLHDEYKFEWKDSFRAIPVSSFVMDSKGDIWMSLLPTGGLAKFDRGSGRIAWWDVPVLRTRPYGITIDHDDNVWMAGYHDSGLERFDPRTGSFRHFPLTLQSPTNIRRPVVDSKGYVWAGTWGSRAMQNGALYRLDPKTGLVDEYKIGIEDTNPYDVEVDGADNVWVATDNHVLKFDPKSRRYTAYPVTTRTDLPKLEVTRDGAVWFGPRNAGQSGGYGGAATVLFPDKDAIESFAPYYAKDHHRNRRDTHEWPSTPVTGKLVKVPATPQNPCEFANSVGLGAGCSADKPVDVGGSGTLKGGAARE